MQPCAVETGCVNGHADSHRLIPVQSQIPACNGRPSSNRDAEPFAGGKGETADEHESLNSYTDVEGRQSPAKDERSRGHKIDDLYLSCSQGGSDVDTAIAMSDIRMATCRRPHPMHCGDDGSPAGDRGEMSRSPAVTQGGGLGAVDQ